MTQSWRLRTIPCHEPLSLLVHPESVTEQDSRGLYERLGGEESEEGDDEGGPAGVVVRQI